MLEQSTATHFAPAERADEKLVHELSAFVNNDLLIRAISASIDGYLLILNQQRQVLAMNQQLIDILKVEDPSCFIGSRPGEVIGCIHALQGPSGCGTSKTCRTCGAVISILACQKEKRPVTGECLATVGNETGSDSIEFRVRATPIDIGGQSFTILLLQDISGEKRKEALERTFFHDILNTVGGLMGWGRLLQQYTSSADPRHVADRIVVLSQRLKQEIEDQRRLIQAENGTLATHTERISIKELFESLRSVFEAHPVANDRNLAIREVDPAETIVTDSSILSRILTNMLKNAFEAIQDGETVKMWYEPSEDGGRFCVHNPGFMPEDVQLRMFKRSFSTKGENGRGIGTYSMKLFGERYLRGKVAFESSPDKGTTFHIQIPNAK